MTKYIPSPTSPRNWQRVFVHEDRNGAAIVQVWKNGHCRGRKYVVASMLLRDEPVRANRWAHLRTEVE